MINYLIFFIAGLLGILIATLIKIRSLRRRSKDLVIDVSFKSYIKQEWDNLFISILAVIIFIFIYDEVLKVNEKVADYISKFARIFFIAVGYMGASIINAFMSNVEKLINIEISNLTKNKN